MNDNGEIILPGAWSSAMPIRDDITILPADNHKDIIIGKLGEYMRKYVR